MSFPGEGYSRPSRTPDSGDQNMDPENEFTQASSSCVDYISYQSSTSPSTSGRSMGTPRKRKRSASQDSNTRLSRRRRHYNTKYHTLFNQMVRDLRIDAREFDEDDLHTSQIGITKWSPQEKDQLFRGLARYGRDNLLAIAALIESKTELEVHIYLRLLQEASTKQHLFGEKHSLIRPADIPAALDVSEECNHALDKAADALEALQQRCEAQEEKQKHADLWRLDQKTAGWVNRCLREGEERRIIIHEQLPAAELLDLGSFLKLSANIFMNSSEPSSNYRSFVPHSEKPSIMFTAFAELYTLVLSITKRLVQSSLFFAMSRLRATQSSSYAHSRLVKKADIRVALKAVGMKNNATDYWVQVPRRCRLNVYDQSSTKYSGEVMEYNEIERLLTQGKSAAARKFFRANASEDELTTSMPDKGSLPESESESESESEAESECRSLAPSSSSIEDPISSSSGSDAATEASALGESFDERLDTYLECSDENKSRIEELRLWKILGVDPPGDFLVDQSSVRRRDPGPYRKERDDLDDWREWVDFKPTWEAYDLDGLDSDLIENRRHMRVRSTKVAIMSQQGHQIRKDHKENPSRALRPREVAENGAISSNDQQSANLGETSEDESSISDGFSLNEEDSDVDKDYLENGHSEATGDVPESSSYDDDDRSQSSIEGDPGTVVDASSSTSEQRPRSNDDDLTSSEAEEENNIGPST